MATAKKKAKSKSKTMAKSSDKPIFSDQKPDHIKAGERGQENVGMDDISLPRLDVLQDMSPQRKRNDPLYIEGAAEGILFNTVTGELYGDEIYFVPCYYKKEWLIWKQQNAGGGLQGVYGSEAEAQAAFSAKKFEQEFYEEKGQKICSYEIVDTANHYGILFSDPDKPEEICLSMSKSKMKVNRQFNTLVKMVGGDRFSRVYKISTFEDQNKQNQKYYNLKIQSMGYAPENLYAIGEKMYESLASNARAVNHGAASEATPAKTEKGVIEEDDEY